MDKNPRTGRLLEKAGSTLNIRLSQADRAFLRDLSKALIIDAQVADSLHYAGRAAGARRRLDKLVEAGILQRIEIGAPKGMKKVTAWQFANRSVARAWGGDVPGVGTNRSHYHELLAGRAYFELGRPDDFKLAHQFTRDDQLLFGGTEPDAIARNARGEVIFVEADSGHYTKTQIRQKQQAWEGVRQFWIQPRKAMAVVPVCDGIGVVRV